MTLMQKIKDLLGIASPILDPGTISKTNTIDSDGSLTVLHDHGTKKDSFGVDQPQMSRWRVSPEQLEKHAPMFVADMSPGELTAYQDAIQQYNDKQAQAAKNV